MFNAILNKLYKFFIRNKYADGFINEVVKEKDYIHNELGGNVAKKVLFPNKRCDKYSSRGELQKRNGNETMACVTYSAENSLETQLNRLKELVKLGEADEEQVEIVKIFEYFGFYKDGQANISDRFTAKMANTSWRGNTFTRVTDSIRKNGICPEYAWEWVDGWNNYYRTIPEGIKIVAKRILEYIEFKREWVEVRDFEEARKYGPPQTAIYAYPYKRNDIYQRTSKRANHAVMTHYEVKNQHHGIGDSYMEFNKKIAWDYNMNRGMLTTIHLKKSISFKYNKIEIDKLKRRGLEYIMLSQSNGEIFKLGDGELEKIDLKNVLNKGVKKLVEESKLIGISNELYRKLKIT